MMRILIKIEEKILYFVAETKLKDKGLRPSEVMKIICGKSHFNKISDVEFKDPISSPQDLL